jgi:predicted kinase
MLKISALVGLPASGKTTLGEKMEEENEDIVYIDDITIKNGLDDIEKAVNLWGAIHIVISDVFLCRAKDREYAIKKLKKIAPDYELEWIFFENNPEKCLKNADYRNKQGDTRKIKNMIVDMSKQYTIPEGYVPLEIWQEKE